MGAVQGGIDRTKGVFNDVTGKTGADAAKDAADTQREAGLAAIDFQKEALETIRSDLQPFRELASPEQLQQLSQAPLADVTAGVNVANAMSTGRAFNLDTFDPAQNNMQAFRARGGPQSTAGNIRDAQSNIQQNPLFQAISDETSRRTFANQAASGKLGSGGTSEELQNRLLANSLPIAQQQFQQDFDRANIGFGQDVTGRGVRQGEQAQQFAQQAGIRGINQGEQAQAFGQDVNQLQAFDQSLSSGLNRNLTAQGQRYNQLFDLTRMGQNAAAQQGTATGSTANSVGNTLTGIGNAQAAGQIGAAQARAQGLGNILNAGATVFAASDITVKENIEYLGDNNGVPWFKFDYIEGDKAQFGTMAQWVEDEYPNAVLEINGVKHVNYGALPCH